MDYTYDAGTYGKGHLTSTTFGGGMAQRPGGDLQLPIHVQPGGPGDGAADVVDEHAIPDRGDVQRRLYVGYGRADVVDGSECVDPVIFDGPDRPGTQTCTYDADGRLAQMGGNLSATATYGPAGEMLSLTTSFNGLSQSWSYNSMLQMVHESAPGLDMT